MPPRVLDDTESGRREAIAALGGVVKVGEITRRGRNAVSNWYTRGFPSEVHHVLAPRLRRKGYVFSPRLFKQTEEPRNGGKK